MADYTATGAKLRASDFLLLLPQTHGRGRQPAAGLNLLAEALDRVERTEGRWIKAELHRVRDELMLTFAGPSNLRQRPPSSSGPRV